MRSSRMESRRHEIWAARTLVVPMSRPTVLRSATVVLLLASRRSARVPRPSRQGPLRPTPQAFGRSEQPLESGGGIASDAGELAVAAGQRLAEQDRQQRACEHEGTEGDPGLPA